MKSFLKDLKGFGQKAEAKGGILIGKTLKVGPYTIKPEAVLGEGGFATIYKARDTNSNTVYALKHMHLMGDKDAIADCKTEVETLQRLQDVPTVLTLRGTAFAGLKGQEQEAFLLLDLCQDNLVDHISKRDSQLPDVQVITIFHAVCKAVAAMHHMSPPLAHRDLKAENVLLHNQGHWVLCDFGSTTSFAGVYESTNAIMAAEEIIRKYTTPAYRAPEMYDLYARERIDTKADIWALGCLLFFIAYGKLAFVGEAKLQVLNGDYTVPPRPQRPEALRQLLRRMLTVSPADRPDIDAVLQQLGQLATNLNVDKGLAAASSPSVFRPTTPAAPTHQQQHLPQHRQEQQQQQQHAQQQPVSGNPAELVAAPLPASGHVVPSRRASSGNLKGASSSNGPVRSSSPAVGGSPAPLSPTHLRQAGSSGGDNLRAGSQGALFAADSRQSRPSQQADSRPLPAPVSSPSAASASSSGREVAALRQQVLDLQVQNRQLQQLNKQQQATITLLQRELQDGKGAVHGDYLQQPPLVSLNSWSQSAAAEPWDAFSNHSDHVPAAEPSTRAASANAQASPLSPQRQAAAAKAQAFIRAQASNVQSMQDLLPEFDPFGIGDQGASSQQSDSKSEQAVNDAQEEATTPLSGGRAPRPSFGSRHRRTTSEPTPMDSWQSRSDWPLH